MGTDVHDHLAGTKTFVSGALAAGAAWRFGQGHGPLDHFFSTTDSSDLRESPPGAFRSCQPPSRRELQLFVDPSGVLTEAQAGQEEFRGR